MAEGFKDLPVVTLERENESWEGHQPDRIAAYQPRLSEFKWDTRRRGKRVWKMTYAPAHSSCLAVWAIVLVADPRRLPGDARTGIVRDIVRCDMLVEY
ncbi:hypothetical protein GOA98_24530 [Sinorhizobium meliloti]|nr:hypothetical protein [Sinorhizobium meliloti]